MPVREQVGDAWCCEKVRVIVVAAELLLLIGINAVGDEVETNWPIRFWKSWL